MLKTLILTFSFFVSAQAHATIQCGSMDKGYFIEFEKELSQTSILSQVQVYKNGVLVHSGLTAATGFVNKTTLFIIGDSNKKKKVKVSGVETMISDGENLYESSFLKDKEGLMRLEFGKLELDCEVVTKSNSSPEKSSAEK